MNYTETLELFKDQMTDFVNGLDEKFCSQGEMLTRIANPESVLAKSRTYTLKAEEELHEETEKINELFIDRKSYVRKQKQILRTYKELETQNDAILCAAEMREEFNSKEEKHIQSVKADLEKQQNDLVQTLTPLQLANDRYRSFLGLDITQTKDGLMFSLKNVCRNNPNKLLTFKLNIQGNVYVVTQCNPPLPDLEKLLHELNSNNDLGAFVVGMRKNMAALTNAEDA